MALEADSFHAGRQTAEADADKAQADTEAQQRNSDAVGQAVLDLSYTFWKASGLESTLTALATAHPSAWASEQKAVAHAGQVRTDATATALSTKDTAQSNADKLQQLTLNAYYAQLQDQNLTAGLEAHQRLTITARDKAIADLQQEDFLNQLFSYNARHPEDLTLLSTLPGSHPITPQLTIANPPGVDPYDGALTSQMFSRNGNNVGFQFNTHVPPSSVDDVIVRTANATKTPATPADSWEALHWNKQAAEAGYSPINAKWHIENTPNAFVPGSDAVRWSDVQLQRPTVVEPLQLDLNSLNHVPDTTINSLVDDGRAYSQTLNPNSKYTSAPKPLIVVVVVPQYTLDGVFKANLIFVQIQPMKHVSFFASDGYDAPDGPPYYKLIDILRSPSGDPAAGRMSQKAIAELYIGRFEQALLEERAASLTVPLHILPTGAAIDELRQGHAGEAAISLVGDAGMLLSLGGSKLLSAARTANTASKAAYLTKAGQAVIGVGLAAEGGAGLVRAGQSVYHFNKGDSVLAAAELGEAVLRLLGVSASVALELKAARRTVVAPGHGVGIVPQIPTQGEVGKYTTRIKWGIREVDARPAGPGFWGKRTPQTNPAVDAFELKINPNNESYYLPHPKGGYVQFENLVGTTLQDGKLVVNIRSIYKVNDLPEFATRQVMKEATRQVEAAAASGLKVEWLVSNTEAASQLTTLFKREGVKIEVTYFAQ